MCDVIAASYGPTGLVVTIVIVRGREKGHTATCVLESAASRAGRIFIQGVAETSHHFRL
jgi:hypothetical protein